jgi:putative flippase GtrA
MIFKLLKFGLVGLTGMVIDFSITILLKEKLNIHRYISSSAGFTVAASSNYLLNRIWTFQSSNPKILIEYSSFIIISIIGLAINIAKFFAIVVTTLWNFFVNYYLTFNQ